MLLQLNIKNYIFIDKAAISFQPGMNVITGETGAGKSIIIGALELTLGAKASEKLVKHDRDQLTITSVFNIKNSAATAAFMEKNGIDNEDDQLILKRTVNKKGRSRCFINDTFVKVNTLKEIAANLIDIHSQHQNHFLFREKNHQVYFDFFLQNNDLLSRYKQAYRDFTTARKEFADICRKEEEIKKEKDFLEFTIKELKQNLISESEYNTLKEKLQKMIEENRFRDSLAASDSLINDQALPAAENASARMEKTNPSDNRFQNIISHLGEAVSHLQEAKEILAEHLSGPAAGDSDIDALNAKLAGAERMVKKYGLTLDDLQKKYENAREKLEFLEDVSFKKNEINKKYKAAANKAVDIASDLHIKRKEGINTFSSTLQKELDYLDMAAASIGVELEVNENEDGVLITFRKAVLNSTGLDKIKFTYKPSSQSPGRRLKEIASGGEVSRIMLALKTVLQQNLPVHTMVFDEIDTGIGGNTAVNTGKKIKSLAAARQLIVITHLPQIARYADTHFKIAKKETSNKEVLVSIRQLNKEEKVSEISRMISGKTDNNLDLSYAQSYIEA
ncbi:MAG TPA: DNA repair protein RecN [Spirochaetota bacterium]|nr:DNA repair protein RecN [Spirochaetota bacterium]